MLLKIIIAGLAAEIAGLAVMLVNNRKISAAGEMIFFAGFMAALLAGMAAPLLCIFLAFQNFRYYLTCFGLGLAGGALYGIYSLLDKRAARRSVPASSVQRKKRNSGSSGGIHPAVWILCAALIVKAVSNVLNIILGWAVTIPLEWFDILTSVLLIIYLLVCVLQMTPFGLLIYTLIAAVGCVCVYLAVWSAGVMVTGFVFAAIVSAFLSGILITGFVAGGMVMITSVSFISYTPILIPMIALAPAGALMAGGAGLAAAADAAGQTNSGMSFLKKILNTVINIVLVFAVCIPLLTAFTGLSGIFRSKPGEVFGMQFLNRHNLITADAGLDKDGILSGAERTLYASMDVFEGDNYNAYQITDEFNLDADNAIVSILHGGVLHIYESGTNKALAQEACPVKNSRDTVILQRTYETYVLGDEEVFIVNHESPSGTRHYFRSGFPWRNEYLAMSEEEQMDRIYRLMMEDTGSVRNALLQDAALVKLSAQHGQLVHYDLEEKSIVFAKRNDDGTVTFLYQTSPEERTEIATVEVYADSRRIPYFWDNAFKCINVLTDASHLGSVLMNGSLSEPVDMHRGREIISMNSIHNYNDDYCIVSMTPDKMYVFNYPNEQWVSMDLDPAVTEHCTGILQAGSAFYTYYYPEEDFLRKYTYLKDMAEMKDWPFRKKYIESHYHGLRYIYRDFDETFGAGN